ncbi:CmpA/NrtA family ABC transporter substrate-binding protein [Nitratireductor sp. ZSWI3]|uniref:CmpA/NrtA family ABC transporter substrate-binding protein n=1 Tax=Nitratireductor sp. ZSWI3 TaxID=2966359 RepID=UPI00214FC024|nr:CmpA/NrtA family ABC transporter substrate-binding protein [Nitratireductor sp. ZSWI3]MCR4264617.1 ABC transporter substrate-binding protein [Nitratireductor sp. ZSWI3]
MSRETITAGFIPLLDAAIMVVAREQGFADEEGLELALVRETSWANIRDRLAIGHFQVAHMLAPMPIAFNLGLTPLPAPTIVPMALGLGGNAVTVSGELWRNLEAEGASADLDPRSAGEALRRVVARRRSAGRPLLRFAVVHPHSGHNYELRYWMAACGIDPDVEIDMVIVPPPLMADALENGSIDGFCVGEPWNTAAVKAGHGRILTAKAAIWRSSPEKVLGVSAGWGEARPDTLAALLRAMYRAAQWCADAGNRSDLAAMLAEPGYVGRPSEWMLPALSGDLQIAGDAVTRVEDFFLPFAKAATFPWKSHALWFYSQMARWGQVEHTPAHLATASGTYRPDLYRLALKPLGAALPGANAKVEGALRTATPVGSAGASLTLGPDGFFDESLFDPDQIDAYIAAQAR